MHLGYIPGHIQPYAEPLSSLCTVEQIKNTFCIVPVNPWPIVRDAKPHDARPLKKFSAYIQVTDILHTVQT